MLSDDLLPLQPSVTRVQHPGSPETGREEGKERIGLYPQDSKEDVVPVHSVTGHCNNGPHRNIEKLSEQLATPKSFPAQFSNAAWNSPSLANTLADHGLSDQLASDFFDLEHSAFSHIVLTYPNWKTRKKVPYFLSTLFDIFFSGKQPSPAMQRFLLKATLKSSNRWGKVTKPDKWKDIFTTSLPHFLNFTLRQTQHSTFLLTV